jgi:hypothetical protein
MVKVRAKLLKFMGGNFGVSVIIGI